MVWHLLVTWFHIIGVTGAISNVACIVTQHGAIHHLISTTITSIIITSIILPLIVTLV